jgi:hypothetical protein
MDCLDRIGVGKSNREVIFASKLHLAAKATSGPILQIGIREYCVKVKDRRKSSKYTSTKPMSGYRLIISHLLRRSTERPTLLLVNFK